MFKKIVLKNRLRVLFLPQKGIETVTVLVLVGTGSKYEKKEENGISHFLEHMCFKGTKKRPSSKEISEVIDRVGGIYNAFTSQEYTGYFAKVPSEKLELALDWVSDILLNSIFPEEEIEREKKVVFEEINMVEDNPMSLVENLWLEGFYGDQPAGWPLTGKKETVKNLNREKILNYRNTQYVAQNSVLVISGNFNLKFGEKKAKDYFWRLKNKEWRKREKVFKTKKPTLVLKKREVNQAHLILGVEGVNTFDKRKYSQKVLANILGGMMSSRLFQKIRDEMGIAYYIQTESHSDLDSGYLATSAGLELQSVKKGIVEILKEYKEIQKNLSLSELKKAKENLKGKISLILEASDSRGMFFGLQELLENKILTQNEIFRKIDEVSLSQVKTFSSEIFKTENLVLAIVGPFEDKREFEEILKL